MVHMGVVRAEGTATAAVLGTDKFVVQRMVSPNSYYQPFEATIAEVNTYVKTNSLAGNSILGAGTAVLVAGSKAVALATITAGSKVLLTAASGAPVNALGYTLNAGVGFTITSENGGDTNTVSWLAIA